MNSPIKIADQLNKLSLSYQNGVKPHVYAILDNPIDIFKNMEESNSRLLENPMVSKSAINSMGLVRPLESVLDEELKIYKNNIPIYISEMVLIFIAAKAENTLNKMIEVFATMDEEIRLNNPLNINKINEGIYGRMKYLKKLKLDIEDKSEDRIIPYKMKVLKEINYIRNLIVHNNSEVNAAFIKKMGNVKYKPDSKLSLKPGEVMNYQYHIERAICTIAINHCLKHAINPINFFK